MLEGGLQRFTVQMRKGLMIAGQKMVWNAMLVVMVVHIIDTTHTPMSAT
jgi:hypothetical protein